MRAERGDPWMLLTALAAAGVIYAMAGRDAPREMAGPGYLPLGAPLRPPPAPPPRKGATAIDFDLLSYYDYDPEADVIPRDVRALDGKLVELRGVMYYAVPDPNHVTDFYMMPNHMVCCFGTPRYNEIVDVRLARGAATEYLLNFYLVRGKLSVGAIRDDEGTILCLYRIADAEVEVMQ